MPDLVEQLTHVVAPRLREIGYDEPNQRVIGTLFEIAYLGTLRREEAQFVRGSMTYADPKRPDLDPPLLRRASYPAFTKFGSPEVLTVQTLVKLARAIDRWSGSIAVFGTRGNEIVAWGVVDQLVQQNVMWHRESDAGFGNPGLLTVAMDGIGDISAYSGEIFLGGLKAQALITREHEALESNMVSEYCSGTFAPFAQAIAHALGADGHDLQELGLLIHGWRSSIARLCIGLRQRGTGGAFLLTPKPINKFLQIGHQFEYLRLKDAAILHVLDQGYSQICETAWNKFAGKANSIPADLVWDASFASTDAADREEELTGAVKLVASLAAVDGLVLMTPALAVVGFGVKIGSTPSVTTAYDGADFARRGSRARKVDLSKFGTRHGSMLRYCAQDRDALGIVVSQDGYVRLIMTVGNNLVFWDNVKLFSHEHYSRQAALRKKERRERRGRQKISTSRGYTNTPKTVDALMKGAPQLDERNR